MHAAAIRAHPRKIELAKLVAERWLRALGGRGKESHRQASLLVRVPAPEHRHRITQWLRLFVRELLRERMAHAHVDGVAVRVHAAVLPETKVRGRLDVRWRD